VSEAAGRIIITLSEAGERRDINPCSEPCGVGAKKERMRQDNRMRGIIFQPGILSKISGLMQ